METRSYEEHNAQYTQTTLEDARAMNEKKTLDKDEFLPDQPLGKMLQDYAGKLKYAVDIGSGAGWISQLLSQNISKVYAIEPSQPAQDIAKRLYPDRTNIEYMCGFAEEQMAKLVLTEPTIFVSSCVLSHLSDETVMSICKKIDELAVEGSVISFSENWSERNGIQEEMWYSRTKDWWKSQFPQWDLVFKTDYPSNRPGMYKGFYGHKHVSFVNVTDEEYWGDVWNG